jgi:hypothetical protein
VIACDGAGTNHPGPPASRGHDRGAICQCEERKRGRDSLKKRLKGSAHSEQDEILVEPVAKLIGEDVVRGVAQTGVTADEVKSVRPCCLQQRQVRQDIGHFEFRDATLARAEEIAGAPQFQVDLGDGEPVAGAGNGCKALLRQPLLIQGLLQTGNTAAANPRRPQPACTLDHPLLRQEDAVRLVAPPPHPAPQLVEL